MKDIDFEKIISLLFSVNSIWSVVIKGAIWFTISLFIIVSSDSVNLDSSLKRLKSNLGFFLMFLLLSGSLIYLLFGYTTT